MSYWVKSMSVVTTQAEVIERLYQETDGYADNPADAQLWYNRGYANGMVAYFRAQGHEAQLPALAFDAPDVYAQERVMEWHKAYHHGFEMGQKETGEVVEGQA